MIKTDFRYDINALRALAVLVVIGFHYRIPGFSNGFVGVDIFFVISGYLISKQIIDNLQLNTFKLSAFFYSRVRRIVPALAVVVFATLLWGWFFFLPDDFVNLNRKILAAILFVSNIAYANEHGYFDAAASTKPLLHTWTLAVEWQFYVVLPFYLLAVKKFFRARIYESIFLLTVASLLYMFFASVTSQKLFYSTPARMWEFLAGALLASAGVRPKWLVIEKIFKHQSFWLRKLHFFSLLILLSYIFFVSTTSYWPSTWTLVPVLCTVSLMGITAQHGIFDRLSRRSIVQSLGEASYSLYLWHWPVWVAVLQLDEIYRLKTAPVVLTTFALFLTFGFSWLSWRFVEIPVRFHFKAWWSNRRLLFGFSLLSVLSLSSLAIVLQNKGLPSRLPDYVSRAFDWKLQQGIARDRCWSLPPGNQRHQKDDFFCTLGDSSLEPSFILWGDSHAHHMARAVDLAALEVQAAGVLAWKPECEAFYSPTIKPLPDAHACTSFNRSIESWLQTQPAIHTYVIAFSWGNPDTLANVVRSIRYLLASGKRVIWIGPVAVAGFDAPRVWANAQMFAGKTDTLEATPVDLQERLNKWRTLQQMLKSENASKESGTSSLIGLDMSAYTCDIDRCYAVKDGKIYFSDNNHLTFAATQLAIPDLKILLSKR